MTREVAKRLRRDLSAAELDVWNALAPLRDAGLHVRKQHPIGRYVADFAIARERLAIEVDGPFHDWSENLDREEARQASASPHPLPPSPQGEGE